MEAVIHPFAEHIGHSIKKEKKNQKLVYNSIGFFKIMILFFFSDYSHSLYNPF